MKSDDVRRSVRSAHTVRDAGDAPNMGRVSRIPGTGLPKRKRKLRHRKPTGRGNRSRRNRRIVVAAWTLLIATISAISLTAAIWFGLKFKTNSVAPRSAVNMVGDSDIPVVQHFPSLSEAQQIQLVKDGLAVRDPVQISEYFRQGDLSLTDQVAFLKGLEANDGALDRYEWLGSININGQQIDRVLVHFKKDERPRNRIAAIIADSTGKWRIDFDAFARTSTPSWDSTTFGDSEPAKVRVYVTKDNYYNGLFKNEKEWMCVGFASPDSEKTFTGYCKIGSPQASAMKWIVSKDTRMNRAFLEIRHVDGAEPRQFIISQVIAEDWVLGVQSFDKRFQ